jgi:hypothetical protein
MEESYIWSKIQDYYGETKYNASAKSVQNDRIILGRPFQRWYIAPAAMVFQAICGSVYAWSVFNHPVDNAIYGSDQVNNFYFIPTKKNRAESTFSACLCMEVGEGRMGRGLWCPSTPDFLQLFYRLSNNENMKKR